MSTQKPYKGRYIFIEIAMLVSSMNIVGFVKVFILGGRPLITL
jgi:hypothetical protein